MVGRGGFRILSLGGKEGEKVGEVARIGFDGMGRRSTLGGEHVEEERKLRGVFLPRCDR